MAEAITQQFHKNVVAFLEELVEQFNDEEQIIMAHILLKNNQISPTTIIDKIGKAIHVKRELIKNRDDAFFNQSGDIISSIHPSIQVNILSKVWSSERIDEEDREIIWQWIDSLLHIYEKYLYISA